MPLGVSSWKTGAPAPPSKCPTNVTCASEIASCQEMYGTLPENVMSGRVASFIMFDTGCPALKSSKWSPPTSRETKTACLPSPRPRSSCHTTHGTVVPPGLSVPAATRGFSASRRAIALSAHASSASWPSAQLPKPCAPEVSRTLVWPAVPFPTATQRKPPSAVASATIFAAKTISLLRSPSIWVGSSSYQTTHATVSFGPVNAMSGSTPERVGSMLSVGSPLSDGRGPLGFSRSIPTCCQQNPFTSTPPVGFVPTGHAVPGTACFTAFATKICRSAVLSSETPSFSSHVTHGTGSLPAMVAPPATEGFPAVRTAWMLRDGRGSGPRPWRDARVLVRIDPVGEVVVHLRAVRRKRQKARVCHRGREQRSHGRQTGDCPPKTTRGCDHPG